MAEALGEHFDLVHQFTDALSTGTQAIRHNTINDNGSPLVVL